MSKTAQNLKDYFTTNVAPKVAAGTLLFTTMFTSIGDGKLGQAFGPSAAHAQSEAHAATLPPDFDKVPASIQPPDAPEIKGGKFLSSDIRLWTDAELEYAPGAASNGRMALILYGDNREAKAAAEYVGKLIAKHKGVDVSFLWAADNDDNPNNVRIAGYANGLKYFELDVGNARMGKEIAQQLIKGMKKAYAEEFEAPKIVRTTNAPQHGPGGID